MCVCVCVGGSVNGRGGGCVSCASAAAVAGFAGDFFYFLIGCCGGPAKKVLQYENNGARRCTYNHVLQLLQ